MGPHISIAIEAARAGGEILQHYFEGTLERRYKADLSIVTKADEEAEEVIVAIIKKNFSDHDILAEEGGAHGIDSPYRWHIDPLDGTQNFANEIPLFAVSIALEKEGEIIAGVVYNPVTSSLFYAERGEGAFWNETKISVSDQNSQQAMVTFGRSRKSEDIDAGRDLVYKLQDSVSRVRILGCAALESAYVARGGTEGYINLGTKTWDYAAGSILIQEAGGKITDLKGNVWNFDENYFVASNGIIHDDLTALTNDLYPDAEAA